jgi:acetyl-CoA acetyltransferase
MDQVAIVGVGASPFGRYLPGRSAASLAMEAARNAIVDAGLGASDIDGICTSGVMRPGSFTPDPGSVQEALGIPVTTWGATVEIPFSFLLMEAVYAVFSGACRAALVVHAVYRTGNVGDDPFRARLASPSLSPLSQPSPPSQPSQPSQPSPPSQPSSPSLRPPFPFTDGYASFAARYLHDYGATRADLALVALNDRQHAVRNEQAVMRHPLTMEDYEAARMIRWPLGLLDMDIPIDGAVAVVVTGAGQARDLPHPPVLIHAIGSGRTGHPNAQNTESLEHLGQQVTISALRPQSDLWTAEADLLYAYDGYTIIALNWLENLGYCGRGEAGAFLRDCWDPVEQVANIGGRVPMNSHGGNLSEGGTQGAGDIREAVRQLRGECGVRQVPGEPSVALLALGGMYMNSSVTVLRTE